MSIDDKRETKAIIWILSIAGGVFFIRKKMCEHIWKYSFLALWQMGGNLQLLQQGVSTLAFTNSHMQRPEK